MMNPSSLYPFAEETFSFFPFDVIIRDAPNDALKQERERVIAHLCVELIEHYGYQSHQILLGELITIPSVSGKTYSECDVMVRDEHNNILLIQVETPADYDCGRESALNHLFKLGRAYQGKEKNISQLHLVYYTHIPNYKDGYAHCITIDFLQYPDLISWLQASKPTSSEIPSALGKKELPSLFCL